MRIAVLPGDDIGPEITDAALDIVRAASNLFDVPLEFEMHEVGMASHRRCGTTLPPAVVEATKAADGVLLGPGGMTAYPPVSDGGVNIPGTIRKALNLYANIRPAKARAGIAAARRGLDCVIVRENSEGFYADRNLHHGYGEFMPTLDTAISLRLITAQASRRIAERAFAIAAERTRTVTVVGKRHVLQVTDGLFMREVEAVAERYPNIALREMDVDAMAGELYLKPEAFDVILTTNMFGDILSNLANALAGSLGLSSSLNVGDEHAAANAGHGSAPDIAGRGVANPAGLILSSALLMDWLGSSRDIPAAKAMATAMQDAIDVVLGDPHARTADLGGDASTRQFSQAVIEAIKRAAPSTLPGYARAHS